jgi:hypothetical protein
VFPPVCNEAPELAATAEGLQGEKCRARAIAIVRRTGEAMRQFERLALERPGLGWLMRDTAGLLGARHFVIESINEAFKGQLDLERHGVHTPAGVTTRVLQRILALTAAIGHHDQAGQPVKRSLLAYDH